MYNHMTFSKKKHTTPLHTLHLTIQNILLAVNPFHCFFARGPRKNTRAMKCVYLFLCKSITFLQEKCIVVPAEVGGGAA